MSDAFTEIAVIGAGPAGMAAAIEARRLGASVTVIDEQPSPGGQIYRQLPKEFAVRRPDGMGRHFLEGQHMIAALERSGAEIRTRTTVWAIHGSNIFLFDHASGASATLSARRIILATGAYDRPVAFPGWTLPGVITAGAAQLLVKTQGILPGWRVVMAGSGPLLLAFAAELSARGVHVVEVLEASPQPGPAALLALLSSGWANRGLLREGVEYMVQLHGAGVPPRYSSMVVRAEGATEVERVVVAATDRDWRIRPGTERVIEADTVCIGYGLLPSTELARLIGCALRYDAASRSLEVLRDGDLRTSVEGVFAVGDGAAVGGSAAARIEGRLAAVGAATDLGYVDDRRAQRLASRLRAALADFKRLRAALARVYRVGAGIHELLREDTIVCRCEEVTAAAVEASLLPGSIDPNSPKALTRAGMGLCQGRNCESTVAAIVARSHRGATASAGTFTTRFPVRPIPIGALAHEVDETGESDEKEVLTHGPA